MSSVGRGFATAPGDIEGTEATLIVALAVRCPTEPDRVWPTEKVLVLAPYSQGQWVIDQSLALRRKVLARVAGSASILAVKAFLRRQLSLLGVVQREALLETPLEGDWVAIGFTFEQRLPEWLEQSLISP